MEQRDSIDKETLASLADGKLPFEDVQKLLRMHPKDKQRFWTYLELLQERVPWKERILMRVSEHLYVVQKPGGQRVVKCSCGHEFGDYRVNWKLSANVRVRSTDQEFREIYFPSEVAPDPDVVEIREFYCPGCFTQLAVEVPVHGDPPLFEYLPDLDAFYRDWLGKPLDDERPDWYTDKTSEQTCQWAEKNT